MKELQLELLNLIGQEVSKYGFSPKAVSNYFIKVFPWGRLGFHLAFIKHADDFDIIVDFGVRFNDVEDMVNADDSLRTEKQKKSTYSLGVELGNLIQGYPERWKVITKDDVTIIANQITQKFETYALPYFEKYSSKVNAFELLASNDSSVWIHSPFHLIRAKRALALAVLLGYKNQFSSLKQTATEFLIRFGEIEVKQYLNFYEQTIQ